MCWVMHCVAADAGLFAKTSIRCARRGCSPEGDRGQAPSATASHCMPPVSGACCSDELLRLHNSMLLYRGHVVSCSGEWNMPFGFAVEHEAGCGKTGRGAGSTDYGFSSARALAANTFAASISYHLRNAGTVHSAARVKGSFTFHLGCAQPYVHDTTPCTLKHA